MGINIYFIFLFLGLVFCITFIPFNKPIIIIIIIITIILMSYIYLLLCYKPIRNILQLP